jgi:phage terminase small subunit
VPRANRQTLDKRERRFVKGVVEGKSMIQAAKDAGYATSTAEKKSYTILQRPLVKSALTNALEGVGVTFEHIVQPIADALKATRSYVNKDGLMVESQVPDHKIRLEASRVRSPYSAEFRRWERAHRPPMV